MKFTAETTLQAQRETEIMCQNKITEMVTLMEKHKARSIFNVHFMFWVTYVLLTFSVIDCAGISKLAFRFNINSFHKPYKTESLTRIMRRKYERKKKNIHY